MPRPPKTDENGNPTSYYMRKKQEQQEQEQEQNVQQEQQEQQQEIIDNDNVDVNVNIGDPKQENNVKDTNQDKQKEKGIHPYLMANSTVNGLVSKIIKKDLNFGVDELVELNELYWQAFPTIKTPNPKMLLFVSLGMHYLDKLDFKLDKLF